MSIYHRSGDRYVLRTDGFISVHSGSTPGELLTKPLVFAGNELQLNYSTSAAGSLRVEIQQSDGKAIPGFRMEDCTPLYGDQIDQTIHWNGDKKLESLAGQSVRMRFAMQECDLYSFQFK